jgi:hypothetical protein
MRRRSTRFLGLLAAAGLVGLVAVLASGAAGCKQGLNDYCQLDDDCEGDLVCARATNTCVRRGTAEVDGGEVDAAVDARTDAISPPIDAPDDLPIDAPTDAAVDAR